MIAARRALLLALPALALPACGGVNAEDAEQVVRDYVKATNRKDPALCVQLVTDRFLEETTGVEGLEGRDVCRRQLKARGGPGLKLLSIQRTRVEDDRAFVRVKFRLQGEERVQTLRVVEEDGHHLVDGPPVS